MSTPFSSFANATVTFKVRSSVPVYGAFGHLEDNLIDYSVSCFLEQKKMPMANLMNESNQEEIYVEGRCISPKFLSSDIQPEVLADASVNGVSYKFRYSPAIASAFYQENEILGQRINGFLIRTTVWGGQANG